MLELRTAFMAHVIPGVYTFPFTPEEVERAVQAMLNVGYPDLPTPLDVDTGDIEEVARQKMNECNHDLYDRRQQWGADTSPGTLALLEPATEDFLAETARPRGRYQPGYCFGSGWDVPAPWIDLSAEESQADRSRAPDRGRRWSSRR